MNEMNTWLRRVTEYYNMSAKGLVRFGLWFVNADGDIFADIASYQAGAYPIYSYGLRRGDGSFLDSMEEWKSVLLEKTWMQGGANYDFELAFTKAWSRSADTDKEDPGYQEFARVMNENALDGSGCAADLFAPTPDLNTLTEKQIQNNRFANNRILLEYCEEQQHFHYNMIHDGVPNNTYSEKYRVIAETTDRVASPFTGMMHARKINGAIFTFDQVVAEWNYYVFLLLHFSSNVQDYGNFNNPSKEDLRRIEERINFYDGEYEDNEMMKLRTIGVPKVRK